MLELWSAPLDVPEALLGELVAALAPAELQRADALRRPDDRVRFLAARGWRRRLLADLLGCAPATVPIVTDAGGKPRVEGSALRFSAARSAGLALFATSWEMEVGVDVEALREGVDLDGLAARFFTPAERRALAALASGEERTAGAFACWTRKEAYGKGIGVGLDFRLSTVDVWHVGREHALVSGWSVRQVDACPGFAAAIAGATLGDRAPGGPHRLAA